MADIVPDEHPEWTLAVERAKWGRPGALIALLANAVPDGRWRAEACALLEAAMPTSRRSAKISPMWVAWIRAEFDALVDHCPADQHSRASRPARPISEGEAFDILAANTYRNVFGELTCIGLETVRDIVDGRHSYASKYRAAKAAKRRQANAKAIPTKRHQLPTRKRN